MLNRFEISTGPGTDFIDITLSIRRIVTASQVKEGICHVFVPHTTAAVMLNEHADPKVIDDISGQLTAMVPQRSDYLHTEGNSPAHIKAGLIGNSQYLFVEENRLVLGTWQGVFFCEFDGPRTRTVMVKVMPG